MDRSSGAQVFLGLGSNLGDRSGHIARALAELETEGRFTGVSSVYETEPVGFTDQPSFLNVVARLETTRSAEALFQRIRAVEAGAGRVRTFRNAPRTLDVDILLYGDSRLHTDVLTIPHPRMRDRPFVLVPLLEIDPDLVEPGSGTPYRELLLAAGGGGDVRRVMPASALRRQEASRDA
jgi:2-amino-4-hydroxy-6-hydroxymethyldihydropteridine diphosphokinase